MPGPDWETEMPDLRHVPLDELSEDLEQIAGDREKLIGQVERPRPNIGSGPPGRAD